jgi:hypothetical protein
MANLAEDRLHGRRGCGGAVLGDLLNVARDDDLPGLGGMTAWMYANGNIAEVVTLQSYDIWAHKFSRTFLPDHRCGYWFSDEDVLFLSYWHAWVRRYRSDCAPLRNDRAQLRDGVLRRARRNQRHVTRRACGSSYR